MMSYYRESYLLFFLLLLTANLLSAQVNIQVTVTSGTVTTTCDDLFSGPDPLWGVNIQTQGWVYYPVDGDCFTDVPNVQYSSPEFECNNVPVQIEICFQAIENDAVVPCNINADCEESICQNFFVPAAGTSEDGMLMLPDGLDSGGGVNFTIETITAGASNNGICDAADLGTIAYGETLGDYNQGNYNNLCADNLNEPNPNAVGGAFVNDAGVWFVFNSGPEPSGMLLVDALSDPENTGDEIDIQIAAYLSNDNTCDGQFQMIGSVSDNNSLNGQLRIRCVEPNVNYYILVDGGANGNESIEGVFGIQVTDIGVIEGGDLRCEFEDLGVVPEGGMVSTDGVRSNFCAGDAQDPYVQAFASQHSVWFSFIAPSSGNVLIEGISDTSIEPLGVQLAIYRTYNGACNGAFGHLESQYTSQDLDEAMSVSCLYGGDRYFVLVDGSGNNPVGMFSLQVSDAGDITPVHNLDTVLCAGQTLDVGPNTYDVSGFYQDTLQLTAGCDSIVLTNLTVLDSLQMTVNQTSPALGEGNNNGAAEVIVTGGTGNYSYQWCTGETSTTATTLVGGEECCITVTDDNGCERIECFTVNFITDVLPVVSVDSVVCNGDTNGVITFSAFNGLPPYNYTWQNQNNTLNGTGVLNADGEEVKIADLPAGDYAFSIADLYDDTLFTVQVAEPEELRIELLNIEDATCFGACDGRIETQISGGTGNYDLVWSTGTTNAPTLDNLCANQNGYALTVTDANGCMSTITANVSEPAEFIAEGNLLQAVSCFEGADGAAGIIAVNGTPATYQWSNQAMTPTISELAAGTYTVTVTNENGCVATTAVQVPQPSAPLTVAITEVQPISCFDTEDGRLRAVTSGPGNTFSYSWNNGTNQAAAENLGSGAYTVQVMSEAGCEAEAEYVLESPTEITAEVIPKDITCLDPENGGAIAVLNAAGGRPGYQYSLDAGGNYTNSPNFISLSEGAYTVTIRDDFGCEADFPVAVLGPPELLVDLGADQLIRLGESVDLVAETNSNNVILKWSDNDSVQVNTITVAPLVTTTYTVQAFDTVTFCTAQAQVTVSVDKQRFVYIPNVFSPNDDGQNDVFMIFGQTGIVQVNQFQVFSRAGNLVFEDGNFMPEDPAHGWEGDFNGQPLNTGVYVFSAEIEFIDGQTERFTGDVLLIR